MLKIRPLYSLRVKLLAQHFPPKNIYHPPPQENMLHESRVFVCFNQCVSTRPIVPTWVAHAKSASVMSDSLQPHGL